MAGNPNSAKYGYTLYFENVDAYTLLANSETTNISMSVGLSWTGMSNAIGYAVPAETLIAFANTAANQLKNNGKVTAVITFTVKGFNNLASGTVVSSDATIRSTTNVSMTSEKAGYTVT